jgi:hypothetical protein
MHKAVKMISIFILVGAFSFSLLVSCSSAPNTSSSNTTQTAANNTGYQIKLFQNDQQVASLGLTELHTLPDVTLTMSGKSEVGPTLSSVLELAGIKNFSDIKVSGMLKGRLATGELTLKQSDITGEVILSYNNQGKTKLCGVRIPDTSWIIDVVEIRAE